MFYLFVYFLRITKISHKFVILNNLFVITIREINKNIQLGILDLKEFSIKQSLSVKRDVEKAGTLFLLKHMLNSENFELAYSNERKPFIRNRTEHISISHSHDKLAIILNTQENTGIDIELIREKVLNIKEKFLNRKEIVLANNNVEKLVTFWAVKETLYKIYGLKEIEFIENLFIESFDEFQIKGRIRTENQNKLFLLCHETIENYKLVYALQELT